MIENGCCLIHFGIRGNLHLGEGGEGWGRGQLMFQQQLVGVRVVHNKLIYQRIATAHKEYGYQSSVA